MAEIEKYKSVKRFGARYGRKLKERFGKVELEQRKKQKCPYCSAPKVKRIAAGIWECRKCNTKFAGKAYSISKKITAKKEESKDIISQETNIKEESMPEEKSDVKKEKDEEVD